MRVSRRMLVSALVIHAGARGWAEAIAQVGGTEPARLLISLGDGATHAVARQLAEGARVRMNRPVVVEERLGASGRIAAVILKNAPADGSTVALLPIVVPVLAPLVFKDVNYDPIRDFVPVCQVATYAYGLAVPANHPARTMPEFIQWAKANPGKSFFGTGAAGSLPHFLGLVIVKETGVEMTHVGYKGGNAMALELAGGTIPAGIGGLSDFIEFHKAGRIRVLATSDSKRIEQLPDVPTFSEQGLPGIVARGWTGVFAPARTPAPIVDQWNAALVGAVRAPELRDLLISFGLAPTGTSQREFGDILAADIARWGPIVKASGFRGD
ncbi:tripartite tricarboxylate transporter substrate-binding protein [Variovorax sp. J22R24]|uniref:tripartite tricarboxylate transporter substrate-binding protein n=1 Tax=Variovorax gracilis TaxID=3053502 RepID=UPI0025767898|nr:tripartite tricarboxylate transporter substrate-binding protein [Variovorax sp. J22R24]MDM0109819.1 tripartite tricarboxylate transporter substrate-binding protein [Variovorax sp. J22R24]